MRLVAAPIISELAAKHGKSKEVIAQVVERMVEEGAIGLGGNEQLASRLPD